MEIRNTQGGSHSYDNDFDKNEMLVLVYEVINDMAYALFVDRLYRLPYVLAVKTKFLDKLDLKIKDNGKVPAGHRGRSTIDTLIREIKIENGEKP